MLYYEKFRCFRQLKTITIASYLFNIKYIEYLVENVYNFDNICVNVLQRKLHFEKYRRFVFRDFENIFWLPFT